MQKEPPLLDYGTSASGFRLTRRQVKRIFIVLVSLPLVLFPLIDLGCGAEHRSILWPWIDTVQASGYSEGAFKMIQVGMTRQQVDALMCKPLYVATASSDGRAVDAPFGAKLDVGWVRYSYTTDGRCPWGDFAWFGRDVIFQDGVVTMVHSRLWYD